MKILQVNVIYGHGSTGKIVQTLHKDYLAKGQESYVFFGRGSKSEDPRVIRTGFLLEAKLWRFIQLFTGNFLAGSPLSTWNLKRHIKKLSPDVVHLHLINGNMVNVFSLLKWLRENNYKTILTHHAKLMFTGGCGINLCDNYQTGCGHCPYKKEVFRFAPDRSKHIYKKRSSLDLDGSWIKHTYVSPWLMSLAMKSPLLAKADNHVVFNPVDTAIFNTSSSSAPLRERPYAFFPTSVHNEVKGWQYVEEVAKKLNELGLDLLVTGSGDESFANPNIIDIGHISDQTLLADYYRQASFTLVLSKFESFSMPVLESLCCGTPVYGFKAGGPESICPQKMKDNFVDNGDIDALFKAIEKNKNRNHVHGFTAANVGEEFLKLYR